MSSRKKSDEPVDRSIARVGCHCFRRGSYSHAPPRNTLSEKAHGPAVYLRKLRKTLHSPPGRLGVSSTKTPNQILDFMTV